MESKKECSYCGKECDVKQMFTIYEYHCCSLDCLKPLRNKRQAEEAKKNEGNLHFSSCEQRGGGCY